MVLGHHLAVSHRERREMCIKRDESVRMLNPHKIAKTGGSTDWMRGTVCGGIHFRVAQAKIDRIVIETRVISAAIAISAYVVRGTKRPCEL